MTRDNFIHLSKLVYGRYWRTELARDAGVSHQYIWKIADGHRPPSKRICDHVIKAARALQKDLEKTT